ncbi:MAG: YfhL family 4Fe-4S dicluster ferredoxin [Dehalococcoidales bacterium]|jgi:ferredoxin|nr:YfhL family 4Fe-4S dicluster ferredoxin [Dehalococcoidales bacterium]MDP7286088.1 YfhL family 4Fe-4S dicluster ferredoxin [Dehalococcoidales bacterium]
MAYLINDECISCGACEPECPNEAISEGETIYIIDSAKCTECVGSFESSRCVEVCPVDSCVLDTAHEESREQLLEKWQKLHPGETPAT